MSSPTCKHCLRSIPSESIDRTAKVLALVLFEVCETVGVSEAEVRAGRRWKSVSLARHLCVYVARAVMPTRSVLELGRDFNRDHSTILNSLARAEEALLDAGLRQRVDLIVERLKRNHIAFAPVRAFAPMTREQVA